MYNQFPPTTQTIQVRKYVEHWWRSRDEHMSNVLQWGLTQEHNCTVWSAKTSLAKCWHWISSWRPAKIMADSENISGLSVNLVYIYIYCHPQTDCFVISQLYSVARHVGRLNWDQNLPNFTLDLVSDHSANRYIYIYIYICTHIYKWQSSSYDFSLFFFYGISSRVSVCVLSFYLQNMSSGFLHALWIIE